jgi:hypothetical protein
LGLLQPDMKSGSNTINANEYEQCRIRFST